MSSATAALAWTAGILLAAGWAWLLAVWLGYPLVMAVAARWWPHPRRPLPADAPDAAWPRLSVIIAAHNEAGYIEQRIRNLWEQNYPRSRLEILISEDGSSDGTAARVEAMVARSPVPLHLLTAAERLGKAAAINRGAAAAAGEVFVFTDANNDFAPRALRLLAAAFADPGVGAVTSSKAVAADRGVGGGESVYWRYEAWLTGSESRAGGTVAAFGEAMAVRRGSFHALPAAGLINDDLYLALMVLADGRRVLTAPGVHSFESGAADEGSEWERRRRMAAGHWATLAVLRRAGVRLRPAAAAKVWFHQILRPASALPLLGILLASVLLAAVPSGAAPLWLRAGAWLHLAGFGAIAAVGVARRGGLRLGRAEAAYFFCLALAAGGLGAWRYWRRSEPRLWRKVRRAATVVSGEAQVPVGAPVRMHPGRLLDGLFWAGSSFLGGKLLVFASVVVLARLLAPRAFGAVALATSAILVLEILGTLGLTAALVFEEEAVEAAANLCFWITVSTSIVEVAAAWALAPWLARFFHDPALAEMVRALSVCVVLNALGNTHDFLLRRRLAFRTKLIPDLGQAAAKGGASIVLALLGFGAWSLIWGQVLGAAAACALLWWITPWRPRRQWDGVVLRRMLHYAKHIYFLDGSSVLLGNLDTLTIGRMLSASWLGFYTLAFRLPEVVLISVLNVITRVTFPGFSRLQRNPARLQATLLDTARYTALLTLPMAAGMAVLAPAVIRALYGGRWGPSIPVLQVLTIYAVIRCLTHPFGDGYKAIGRPDVLTRTTVLWWIALPPSLILGARWGGIVGVAWGHVATRTAMSLLHVYLVARYLHIRPMALVRCFAPAVEATAVMAAALWALAPWVASWPSKFELAALVPLGAGIYVGFLSLRHPQILRAAMAQMAQLRHVGHAPAAEAASAPEVAA